MSDLEKAAKEWADSLDARFHDDKLAFPRDEKYEAVVNRYHQATEALYRQVRKDLA